MRRGYGVDGRQRRGGGEWAKEAFVGRRWGQGQLGDATASPSCTTSSRLIFCCLDSLTPSARQARRYVLPLAVAEAPSALKGLALITRAFELPSTYTSTVSRLAVVRHPHSLTRAQTKPGAEASRPGRLGLLRSTEPSPKKRLPLCDLGGQQAGENDGANRALRSPGHLRPHIAERLLDKMGNNEEQERCRAALSRGESIVLSIGHLLANIHLVETRGSEEQPESCGVG